MELNEALEVVQQVKNRYKAFAKLEELLSFFAGEYQNLGRLKDEVAKAKAELTKTLGDRDRILADAAAIKKSIADDIELNRKRSSSEIAGFRATVQKEGAAAQSRLGQLQKAVKDLEAEHTGRMDAMRAEEMALQISVNKLREQLTNLKKAAEEVTV